MNQKKKIQMIILCVLLLLVIGAFAALKIYQANAPDESEEQEQRYTVMTVDKSKVREIGIINDTQTINLVKDGETWKCPDDEDFSVDVDVVDSYLENIAAITSDVRIESVNDLSQYGLDHPVLNVALKWDDNMYTIKVGDYNRVIGSYYLSVNDEDTVYTIDSSLFYALDKTLTDFEHTANVQEEAPVDSE